MTVDHADSRTIFVDVTELVTFELRTGIQRVVRELVFHGMRGAAGNATIVPVMAIGEQFYRLNDAGLANMDSPGRDGGGERTITQHQGKPLWMRTAKRALTANAWLYNLVQKRYVTLTTNRRLRGLSHPQPVTIKGSTLVLLDSFWGGSSVPAAAEHAASEGAELVMVAYDLIPITHPQFCDQILVQKFRQLLTRMAAASTRVLAISEFCAEAFRKQFPNMNVQAFPLGHDVRAISGTNASASDWPDALWSGPGLVYLLVGSIEPRKGHQVVLDAFERRWAAGSQDKLLIVGKVGWKVEALMQRIDYHPYAGTKLFIVHHASDTMLGDALARADAAIIASYVEGFGLPLAEAMAAGLPVIASDIPVFREVAGDLARYFTVGDADSLASVLGGVDDQLPAMRSDSGTFVWPDWREAARIFFGHVLQGDRPRTADISAKAPLAAIPVAAIPVLARPAGAGAVT